MVYLFNISMSKILFAYTDESGNTGDNIFDKTQPYFWTGTLFSEVNCEVFGKSTVDECVSLLGVNELHANILGLPKLEIIANRIKALIRKNDYSFIIKSIIKN